MTDPRAIILPQNILDVAHHVAAALDEGASDTLWSLVELKRHALMSMREDLAPSSQGYFPPDTGPRIIAGLWEWEGLPSDLVGVLLQYQVLVKDPVGGWHVAGLEQYDSDWAKTLKDRVRKQDWRSRQGRVPVALVERQAGEMSTTFDAVPPPRRVVASTIAGTRKEAVRMATSKKSKKPAVAAKTSRSKATKKPTKKKAGKAE